jgi:F-type H+-transporting ATPase subunit alpha
MSKLPGSPIPLLRIKVEEKGRIKDIKEIVARIDGLPTCLNGQLVDLGNDVKGIVMGFDQNDVLVLVLGDAGRLRLGREVSAVSEPFRIPVGDALIGRMVDALGTQVDRGPAIVPQDRLPIMMESPPIVARATVDRFLPTGTKIVDLVIPLAQGQRQLILGDRMTGKTTIALDAIINQKGRDMVCVYCCLGKSLSALEKVVSVLHEQGALAYTVITVATDSAPVGEQYLAPFSTASIAHHFASRGRNVLVVFDDLTKHAWAYRQLSLLLDRPPGREAYPGDIFYVQTQLMERAGNFNEASGGGSVTYIGIAETLQGDLTGYIPSNLASMCDGQICMSGTMFAEGVRPAIDFTLSLSIIGGRVQPPVLKALSRTLRADYARYTEILRLSKLQSTVSGESERLLKRGRAILGVLQQGAHHPVGTFEQVLLAYALDRGWLDGMPTPWVDEFRDSIAAFAAEAAPDLADRVARAEALTTEIERMLESVLQSYRAAHEPEA